MNDFENDIETPDDSALRHIADLAAIQIEKETAIFQLENTLAALKKELADVQQNLLPEAMRAAGMRAFTLSNGMKITIKNVMYGSISGEKMRNAIAFLTANGRTALIQSELSVEFAKSEHDKMCALQNAIKTMGYDARASETVNTGSFKKLIKEMREEGVVIDLLPLGFYEVTMTEIKI